jgi:hypothetical protein
MAGALVGTPPHLKKKPSPHISPERRTVDVMGVSGMTGLDSSQPRNLYNSTNAECILSRSASRVATPQSNDPDSDVVWVAMMRQQHLPLVQQGPIRRFFHVPDKRDKLSDEIADADWKSFLDVLRMSYARRTDTFVWSVVVFILAAIALTPSLGFRFGPAFAILVSLCWAVVHWARRL